MRPTTSLYLDLVRALAAFTVFMSHASGQFFTAGLLWQTGLYDQTAVMVFFVLSGFVIAHVLETKERTALDYTAARFGRLYSVVIPALLLTAICDFFGLLRNPDFYYNGPWAYPMDSQVPRYLSALLFVNQSWLLGDMQPGSNSPFWSLGFESIYYVAIGLIIFSRGVVRVAALLLLALFAGPTILVLAPIWLLGFATYHAMRRHEVSERAGYALWLSGAVLLLISYRFRFAWLHIPGVHRGALLADYAAAIGFALNIVGFNALAQRASNVLLPAASIIRWLGSITFALYLFHRPLIQLFAVYNIGAPSEWLERLWLVGGTLFIVATLGHACEKSKGAYKTAFLFAFGARTAPDGRQV
jgi:peptidoglycan/LPS O-acetylase OafA/YrhL